MPIYKRRVPDHIAAARKLLDALEDAYKNKIHTRVMELGAQLQLAGAALSQHGEWLKLHGAHQENREQLALEREMEKQKGAGEKVH